MFIGYSPDLVALLSDETLLEDGGDQLAYTKLYLDEKRRDKYAVRVDSTAELVQNIDGVEGRYSHSSGSLVFRITTGPDNRR